MSRSVRIISMTHSRELLREPFVQEMMIFWWGKGTRWKNNKHLLSLAGGCKCMPLGETAYICVYTVFCLFCLR